MIRVLRKKHKSLFGSIRINIVSVSLFDIVLVLSSDLIMPDQLRKKYIEDNSYDVSDYIDDSTGNSYTIQENDKILILKKPYAIYGSKFEDGLQQIIGQIVNYNKQNKS